MYPIVMVANFSGNVGKTTLTKNLLAPNMPNVKIFAVEDVNAGYEQGEAVQLSAEVTRTIVESFIEAAFSGPVIVDVGASNVSNFFTELTTYDGIHEFISKVVVPTEPSEKVQKDTVNTVKFLIEELEFDPEKIAVVINRADPKIPVDMIFGEMLVELSGMGILPAGTIVKNETFQTATQVHHTIYELAEKDPKAVLQETEIEAMAGVDPKLKVKLALAASTAKKLRRVLTEIYNNLGIPEGEE